MRFSGFTLFLGMGLLAGSLQAQSVGGPFLGFTTDNDGTTIRPILGIPGAAVLANRVQLEMDIRGVVISPRHEYALAARSDDGQVVFLDLRSGVAAVSGIAGTYSGADLLAISPTGSVAAVYSRDSRSVQVIGHLPQAPEVWGDLDASRISGHLKSLAINDEGTVALLQTTNARGATLWVLDSSGVVQPILVEQPTAAAFLANTSNAIVADSATRSALMIMDVRNAATQVPLISAEEGMESFTAVAASEDGSRVFLADAKSGKVVVVDLETRQPVELSCDCRVTGFYPLRGSSVFRLTDTSREPMMVLDASGMEPRMVMIPASASQEAQ